MVCLVGRKGTLILAALPSGASADEGVTEGSGGASGKKTSPSAMPYTGIVLTFVALAGGFYLILLSNWLTAAGLFPKAVAGFEQVYARRPVRATLVGLLTLGPLLVVMARTGQIPHP